MNLKINLGAYLLSGCFTFVFLFLIFNLITKNNYVFTTLQVKKITEFNEFKQPGNCQIILNWKNQKLNTKEAVHKIQKIKSVDHVLEINLEKYSLSWDTSQEIKINNFTNNCEWFVKPVIVTTHTTTLWNYLIQQISNF